MASRAPLLRIAAAFVAALSVSAATAGWFVLSGLEGLSPSTEVTTRTFDTLRRTLDVTVETTRTVGIALEDLDAMAGLVASSSERTATFVEDVAGLTSTRIPVSLRSVQDAMPALIEAGAVVDDTLSTLALFGVEYRPEVPFDQALRDVRDSLDGLPDAIEEQGAGLEELAPQVESVGETATSLAERIRTTRSQLRNAEVILDDYRTIVADLEETVSDAGRPVRAAGVIRVLLVVSALTGFGLGAVLWRLAALEPRPVVSP